MSMSCLWVALRVCTIPYNCSKASRELNFYSPLQINEASNTTTNNRLISQTTQWKESLDFEMVMIHLVYMNSSSNPGWIN